MNRLPLSLLFSLIGTFLSAQIIQQDSTFPIAFTYNNTMDVEAADMDEDGDLDLVLAMEFGENVLLFNDSTRGFRVHRDKLLPENKFNNFPGHDSEDIAIADFDNDGDLDILFVSEDSWDHELLINDGNTRFKLSDYKFPPSTANAVAVIDLNQDSLPEIIIGNNGQNQVYLNEGDNIFRDTTSLFFPKNKDATQDLKLSDIDNDGDLDLIEGIEDGGNNLYLNQNGRFVEANERLPTFASKMETRKVAIGDINNDGFVDLYYCNVQWKPGVDPQDKLLINDGRGYFTDQTNKLLPMYLNPSLDANIQDYNRDGLADILVIGNGPVGDNYRLFLNTQSGKFKDATQELLPEINFTMGISLYSADLNSDGYLDIYIGNFMSGDQLFFGVE